MKKPNPLAVNVVSDAARVLAASDRLDEIRGYTFKTDALVGGGELSLLIAIAACEMSLREFARAEGCEDIQPYIDSIIETQKECEEHGW